MSDKDKIHDVIFWVWAKHSNRSVLSEARMTKMVYLADWEMAQQHGCTITGINWEFNQYGPYAPDVVDAALDFDDLSIEVDETTFGTSKDVFVVDPNAARILSLTRREAQAIDEVVNETKYLSFALFIDHVYSTYPMVNTERYHHMDLPALAARDAAGPGKPSHGGLMAPDHLMKT